MLPTALARYLRIGIATGGDPALDGVRGVAILLVVAFHAAESFVPPHGLLLPAGRWDLATPALNGWIGVQLFFVLSGFLITHHLLRRWSAAAGWAEIRLYLAKRWIRIVPLYCLVLFTVALGVVPHYPVEPAHLPVRVGYHLLFLQDYLPSSILGPLWSLGVEEKFYLLVPVLLLMATRLGRRRRIMGALLAIAAIPLVVRATMVLQSGAADGRSFTEVWRDPFHLNLDSLLLGTLCAFVYTWRDRFAPEQQLILARIARWTGGAGIAALLVVTPLLERVTTFDRLFLFPLIAFCASAWLLGIVLREPGTRTWLDSGWLRTAGRLAYPWYLTHVLVMWWTWGELTAALPAVHALAPAGQFVLVFAAYGTASFVVALVLHYLVEKPCLIWKDSLGTPVPHRRAGRAAFTRVSTSA